MSAHHDPAADAPPDDPPDHRKPHPVTIEVNNKSVEMPDREATGLEIKQAAIAQGVQIEPDFELHMEIGEGRDEVVLDDQRVRLHPRLTFTANDGDDDA